ncbi:Stabilin-1 [Merluccius polli]|uniref:Stabilin-1 n=1 Tax=Merluccius polli TaxID=89951 RepID=A0AA47M3Q1_MERPO|nr:Stabilin-1 [Merluccius polli]
MKSPTLHTTGSHSALWTPEVSSLHVGDELVVGLRVNFALSMCLHGVHVSPCVSMLSMCLHGVHVSPWCPCVSMVSMCLHVVHVSPWCPCVSMVSMCLHGVHASEKCDLPLLSVTKHSGCRHTCLFNQWQPKCCAGYYGRDCQACPGGAGSVCSNHGDCDDGHFGNGTCKCHDGFQGVACELCDAGRYGPACDACRCTPRGACVDGRRGSGECFCEVGWTGERCEIHQAAVPVCSPPCAPQAVCQDNNTCVCRPYYEGNGSTCARKTEPLAVFIYLQPHLRPGQVYRYKPQWVDITVTTV